MTPTLLFRSSYPDVSIALAFLALAFLALALVLACALLALPLVLALVEGCAWGLFPCVRQQPRILQAFRDLLLLSERVVQLTPRLLLVWEAVKKVWECFPMHALQLVEHDVPSFVPSACDTVALAARPELFFSSPAAFDCIILPYIGCGFALAPVDVLALVRFFPLIPTTVVPRC